MSSPDDLPPGFRVTAEELPDRVALAAVSEAAAVLTRVALEQRRMLLGLGFAVEHSVCQKLDETARLFAAVRVGSMVREGALDVELGPEQ